MPTTTWACNKDARVADSGGTSLGAGASNFNPIGTYSGYKYRTLLGFSYSFTGMVSITSAVLNLRTGTQFYVAYGSDPDIAVRRLTAAWSEGTSVALSGTNAVEWDNQPGVTGSTAVADISPSESTWDSVDITTIIQEALAAGSFYGLRLYAYDGSGESSSATDVTEIYSREQGSSDPYITVTYTNNVVPSAPTLTGPADGQIVTLTPELKATHSDPDGDALLDYDHQVSTDPTFASVTHWNESASTFGISGNNITRTYAGTALTRGTTYYWRMRTSSATGATGEGPWSAARSFVVNSLPVATLTEPAATGRTARLTYVPGAGWASPRLVVAWGSTDANVGHAQSKYQVFVTNDADGTTHYDSGTVVSTATSLVIPTTLTEGNKYRIKVRVWDALEQGAYSTELTVRARWAVGLYRFDMGSAPNSISLTTLSTTTGSASEVAVEYGTDTTTATPGTFYSTVGGVPLQRYFFYRVYLYAWGSATPTSPSLDQLTISYSAIVLIPDNWTRNDLGAGIIIADPGSYVYGSQALRIAGDGGAQLAYQLVNVLPNTDYVLSGRIKSLGNSGAQLEIVDNTNSIAFKQSTGVSATQDFLPIEPLIWNSGSVSSVYIRCRVNGAVGTYGWFDALKLEASSIATPWTPGFIGNAVGIDAGGVQIDASAGGLFRLRGATGGTRDTVALTGAGLTFGGDVEVRSEATGNLTISPASGGANFLLRGAGASPAVQLYRNGEATSRAQLSDSGLAFGPGSAAVDTSLYREAAAVLRTDATFRIGSGGFRRWGGTSFPASPSSGDLFWRTDIKMEFFYDGTRWLSATQYIEQLNYGAVAMPLTATGFAPVMFSFPWADIYAIYVDEFIATFNVNSGGTALGASHKWVGVVSGLNSGTTFATHTIDSGASNSFRTDRDSAIGAIGIGERFGRVAWTKTGTPGNLDVIERMYYRIIVT